METHPDQDWKQGEQLKYEIIRNANQHLLKVFPSYQSPDEELLDCLEVCGLGGRKTKECDRDGQKPGPFPEKRLK